MRSRTTEEYKKAVVRKLVASVLSDCQFAIEEGIAFSTLHKWKTRYQVDTSDEGKLENYQKNKKNKDIYGRPGYVKQ